MQLTREKSPCMKKGKKKMQKNAKKKCNHTAKNAKWPKMKKKKKCICIFSPPPQVGKTQSSIWPIQSSLQFTRTSWKLNSNFNPSLAQKKNGVAEGTFFWLFFNGAGPRLVGRTIQFKVQCKPTRLKHKQLNNWTASSIFLNPLW